MKLRIKGNSLRLRLTRGEVHQLDERGEVQDQVRFEPGSSLIYRVKRDAHVATLAVSLGENAIEVLVPEQAAREWCHSELVTLEYSKHTEDGELQIVVEKDFSCLVPRAGEDESDQFPHPLAERPAGS